MFRQAIQRAPGAMPIWFSPPSGPTTAPVTCARGRRMRSAGIAGRRVVDRVVPVVRVRGRDAVEPAIPALERGMLPRDPRVRDPDDDSLSDVVEIPDRGCVH